MFVLDVKDHASRILTSDFDIIFSKKNGNEINIWCFFLLFFNIKK